MSVAPWSGRRVTEARRFMERHLPAPCARGCGRTVATFRDLRVGHIVDRSARPDLTWEPSNWQVECRACSDASGQATALARATERGYAAGLVAGGGSLPRSGAPGQPPPLPVSLSAPPGRPSTPMEIQPELLWANLDLSAAPWLAEYAEVPADAWAPLAMTPPHEEAVGSYAADLIAWAAKTQGVRVRWWQGLALARILEHRADGSLCWEEFVLSCSRRSGKSVVVRLLALWRMVFAPALFGEVQLVVHSATTLRVAKEPMRYAGTWAAAQDHLAVYTNNNNYAIEDREGGHRWVVLPVDKTAGLDTCLALLDEAWSCKPEVVDDDLEPSLLERVSPQLGLVSTAHRRATSLMRGRIVGALAGEGMGRVLLMLWAAPPGAEPGDPATWRMASPHWTPQRESYLRRKYDKALRGEQDPEFDDPDPMQGFIAQYLNVWRLHERATTPGEPVTTAEVWQALTAARPDRVPDAVALEAYFTDGVSVAQAWREGVVSVTDHPDLAAAAEAVRAAGFRGRVTVGASLVNDPALHGLRVRPGQARASAAAGELARLASDRVIGHDGGEHLTGQLLAVRVLRGADGGRLASKDRVDAVKAAAWALASARRPGLGPQRVLLPSTVSD